MQVTNNNGGLERSPQALPNALRESKRTKVLVPYDGSENAEVALADLRIAGLPEDLEAFVAVTDVWLPASPYEITRAVSARRMMLLTSGVSSFVPALRNQEEQRVLLAEARHHLQSIFPFATVRSEALSDTAAVTSAMLSKAERWGANLITIGSKRSPSPHISDFAGAALRVAAKSHCSVRFARPSSRIPGSPVRIIIGIDGSKGMPQAVQSIAQRVWPKASQVRVVLVHQRSPQIAIAKPVGSIGSTAGDDGNRGLNATCVEEVTTELRAAGLIVSTVVKSGVPQDLLMQEAREWEADCVYVDAQGFGPSVGGRFNGSGLSTFAEAVALGAHCSVEVVRAETDGHQFLMPAA